MAIEVKVKSKKREEIVNITFQVREAVSKLWDKERKIVCNKKSRACLVFTPHTTCSIIVNEGDKTVHEDILNFLKQQIPAGKWKHDEIDDNADSHIKASLLGSDNIIPIENGDLRLGTYQAICLVELDGPRERRVIVEIL